MKRVISGLALAILIAAAIWSPGGRARARPNPETFRVSIDEVIRDDDLIVAQVKIETQPGSWVEVVSDKPNRGGVGTATPETAPSSQARLVIVGDHVRWEANA